MVMKLIFDKDVDENLTVRLRNGIDEKEFSYTEMIKLLRDNNKFEESEYRCELTQDQKDRVSIMLSKINLVITENNNE